MGRLTEQRGVYEDGSPYITLVKRDHFPTNLQEALRKLARYEDEEERRELLRERKRGKTKK